MKAELFTCEGLSKNSCLSKSYCGWCVENLTDFCKPMNACDFTHYNSTNSSSSLICEIGNHKYRCIVEKTFMVFLIIVLYIICVFILVDVIKSRMKKMIKAEYIPEPIKSTYESLPKYESLQDCDIANEKTSLLINSEKRDINEINHVNDVNYVNHEKINKLVDDIGSRINFIMFVSLILPTMILYYSNIFLFLVDIFFFIIFVLVICITFR